MRDASLAASVNSADIKFECSQCGQRMVVEKSAAGLTADCPICRTPLTVPPPEDYTGLGDEKEALVGAKGTERSQAEPQWESVDRLEAELAESRAEAARQHTLFKKALEECERLNANATHVQAELKSFQADRQQLKADLALARQAAAAAEAQASELADTLSATQEEGGAVRYQAEVESQAFQERISVAEAHIAARENELAAAQAEHTEALRSLARTRAELSRLNTETAGMRSEIEVLRNDFEMATQELAVTAQHLAESQARLSTLEREHPQVVTERNDWRQKAEGFQRDLVKLDDGRDLLELRTEHAELQKKHTSLEIELAERMEAAKKEKDVLRGIVARQNTDLGVHHSEVRRLRRGRFLLRLIYAVFALGLLALGYVAFYVFAPQPFQKIFGQFLQMHW